MADPVIPAVIQAALNDFLIAKSAAVDATAQKSATAAALVTAQTNDGQAAGNLATANADLDTKRKALDAVVDGYAAGTVS